MDKRRRISFVLILVMIVYLMCSHFFIIKEIHHDCTGKNCPVCKEIRLVSEGQRDAWSPDVFTLVAGLIFIIALFVLPDIDKSRKGTTLV